MKAIRVRRQLDSETLHLPELKEMIGKTVEIIVLEEVSQPAPVKSLDFFMALAPKAAPLDPKEIAAMRADPRYKRFWPLLEIAGDDVIDANAIAELRAASLT